MDETNETQEEANKIRRDLRELVTPLFNDLQSAQKNGELQPVCKRQSKSEAGGCLEV